jgi:hypothetical protein
MCVNEYMYTLIHVYIFTDNACSMNIERTNNFFFIINRVLARDDSTLFLW